MRKTCLHARTPAGRIAAWSRRADLLLRVAALLAAANVVALPSSPAFFGLRRQRRATADGGPQASARRVDGQLKAAAVSDRLDVQVLTEAHALAIAGLRGRVQSAGFLDVPEGLLQRCCAAAGNDVEAAYARLRDILRWRAREGVDCVLESPGAAASERWYRRLLCYGLPGQDRKGRAVMIESVGRWDMEALDMASKSRSEAMTQAHIVVCETLLKQAQDVAAAAPQGERLSGVQRVPGFVAVLDMEGIALRHNPIAYPHVLSVLKEVSKINARYYPEAVEHVFIVNAPGVFQSMWRILAPFVMPSSGIKVDVLPRGEFGLLLQECGRECLPAQLGGALPSDTPPYGS